MTFACAFLLTFCEYVSGSGARFSANYTATNSAHFYFDGRGALEEKTQRQTVIRRTSTAASANSVSSAARANLKPSETIPPFA